MILSLLLNHVLKVLLAATGLPWMGYCIGMLLAYIFRMPLKDIITIGIETGLQNTLIALFILKTTLEAPAGDLAFGKKNLLFFLLIKNF